MGPVLSGSLWRRLIVAGIATVGFVLQYEVGMFDSRDVTLPDPVDRTPVAAGSRLPFTATAYCKGTTTAAGIRVRSGMAASDPAILPLGSIVNISTEDAKYTGLYSILDTGPAIQGRIVDLYMWSCFEALDFGRQPIELTVLRLGWDPEVSAPSLIEPLFRRREAARGAVLPRPPLPERAETSEPPEPLEPHDPAEPATPLGQLEPAGPLEPAEPPRDPAPDDAGEGDVSTQPAVEPLASEGTPAS
jgi:3D (Asp-Asp-Asp) domain-containing protein